MDLFDKLKTSVFLQFKPDEIKGCFLSAFDENGILLVSKGSVDTDKTLDQQLNELNKQYVQNLSKIGLLMCDVVTEFREETDYVQLQKLSPSDYGIVLMSIDQTQIGVILPQTVGVADIQNAFFALKQKYGISGKVKIYVFKTKRLSVV